MTVVKICGLTTLADARAAITAGADLLGLNFHPPSPRYLLPEDAARMANSLRSEYGAACPPLIGIFVEQSAEEITRIMAKSRLDAAQLTSERAAAAIDTLGDRAYVGIRPRDVDEARQLTRRFRRERASSDPLPAILVDAYHPQLYGGTGEVTRLAIAATAMAESERVMLAGGLTAQNVGERLRQLHPWGVDVASGVEVSPGRKDATLMNAFIAAVRGAEPKGAALAHITTA